MARLGLKIFYLRTRERGLSQRAVAEAIGVRQATLSHIEQGVSLPSAALLLELSRFYDVTPTFLLDDERDVVPLPTERWSLRNALVTVGMWVEARRDELVAVGDDRVLCPLRPGASFYDDEAAAKRRTNDRSDGEPQVPGRSDTDAKELERMLDEELRTHPRRRPQPGAAQTL